MQSCHKKIIYNGGQDDGFVLKVFNTLETSNNDDFLSFVKKKKDALEEDALEDNVDNLIQAHAKKCNNIA